MPLTPQAFENIKKSTKEVQGAHGVILVPLQREREIALLSVYGVTSQAIGETFRILAKNQS